MDNLAFIFPGQGSQYVGMGKELSENFPVMRRALEEASDALHLDLKKLLWESSEAELTETQNAQPALLSVSLGAYLVLTEESGARPGWMAGHSLGEYTALTAAGAMSLSAAAPLVRQRGLFMREAMPPGKGTMAAVMGLDPQTVESACREVGPKEEIAPANFNSPQQTVIAGLTPLVEKARDAAKAKGARKVVMLQVAGPFHTALMQPAADRLNKELSAIPFQSLKQPVVANYHASSYSGPENIVDTLVNQLTHPVRWLESMELLGKNGVTRMVEVGPKKVLAGLMRQINSQIETLQVEDLKSLKAALEVLK